MSLIQVMSVLKVTWNSFLSPRLYMVYHELPKSIPYEGNSLERWSDNVIKLAFVLWKFGFYVTPIIGYYLHKKDYFSSSESVTGLAKTASQIGCVCAAVFVLRAVGRAVNPKYQVFLADLEKYERSKDMAILRKYDFTFSDWPVTYSLEVLPSNIKLSNPENKFSTSNNKLLWIIGHIAVYTFGLSLIFPGSISLVSFLIDNVVIKGRQNLVESHGGKRNKLKSYLSNDVDTMFVDNRGKTINGDILVICCEGNAGFYEIGIMSTPIQAGYSVLGWNHCGFGGSTGKPYPDQEQDAINTVMQFALNKLEFQIENIALFAWSIGGYTAAWAAANYPKVKAVVADATFDDLLPLAVEKMPKSWSPLVTEVIRKHVDLNVAELLTKYPGPILVVRRTDDEIISLIEGDITTNRGNDLLIKIMEHRHNLSDSQVNSLREYLCEESDRWNVLHPNSEMLKLTQKYLKDYRSTHCTPLPVEEFTIPN